MPRLNSRSRGFVLGAAMALMVKGPLLMAAFAWTSDAVRGLDSTQGWVRHSEAVISEARRMVAAVSDAERSQRDFLLTGDAKTLEPYQAAILRVGLSINALGRLTAGEGQDAAALQRLWQVSDERLEDLAVKVEQIQSGVPATLTPEELVRGERLMEAVRGNVAAFEASEMASLDARLQATGAEAKRALASLSMVGAVAIAILMMVVVILRRRATPLLALNQIRVSLAR